MTPTLVTPNDSVTLRELCTKAESAIASLDQQIAVQSTKIRQAAAEQEGAENILLESAHAISELQAQLRELHSRHQQAMVSAGVAINTPTGCATRLSNQGGEVVGDAHPREMCLLRNF